MGKARQLYELQEVDLEIDQKSRTLDQVKSQLGGDDDLVAARAALDEARKRLTDLEHKQRISEWETDDLATKTAREEKRLYEGSLKNPRELMTLQQEVDLLREQRREREEHLLAIMIEVDTAEREVGARTSELEGMERKWQEDQQRLAAERTELEADLAALEEKRRVALQQIDPTSVKLYERLRQAKQGRAVAKVEQGRCQGCRISLPISDQQGARMGHELVTCSNCGRILCAG